MSAAPVLFTQFRRINPYSGMMVDADVWQDAHQYHRQQLHLHHLALHGWGIVQGLQVTVVPGAENTVRIEPGLGIDPAGHFIAVSEPHTYHITARDAGMVYLVVQFREVLSEPAAPTAGSRTTPPTRILDTYRIQERDQLPDEPYLELARVARNPESGSVAPARNPNDPRENEIDLRSREQLGSAPLPTVAAAPLVAMANGSLEPRLDVLTEQVRQLGERLATVSDAAMQAAHTADPPVPAKPQVEAGVAPPDGRLEVLVSRVETLALQVAALEHQPQPSPEIEGLRQDLSHLREQLQAVQTEARTPSQQAQAPRLRLAVAQHGGQGWRAHQPGLSLLARELGHANGVLGQVLEPISAADPRGVDVLYLSGYGPLALEDGEVEGIGRLLQAGGVVVGEGCASGADGESGAREFAMAYVELGNRLGRRLTKVERAHPLMTARHVFAEPPPGARPNARLLESDGMVYSDADYGCAWQGGAAERPLARGVIRDALELGVNLAVYRARLTAS
jgi:hypothetical protein